MAIGSPQTYGTPSNPSAVQPGPPVRTSGSTPNGPPDTAKNVNAASFNIPSWGPAAPAVSACAVEGDGVSHNDVQSNALYRLKPTRVWSKTIESITCLQPVYAASLSRIDRPDQRFNRRVALQFGDQRGEARAVGLQCRHGRHRVALNRSIPSLRHR